MKQKEFVTRMFGESILERLKELNMTKAKLCKLAEIAPVTLKRAIEGRSVQMTTIVAICNALEVDNDHDFWETDYYNPRIDRV